MVFREINGECRDRENLINKRHGEAWKVVDNPMNFNTKRHNYIRTSNIFFFLLGGSLFLLSLPLTFLIRNFVAYLYGSSIFVSLGIASYFFAIPFHAKGSGKIYSISGTLHLHQIYS